jgi:NAD(P)-dependent dehydrogenase (short-subunit alcohol dehydrogenase family)
MLLENKNAVVYGGGRAVGSAVAHAFAHEGATVFLAGHTMASVEEVAKGIVRAGALRRRRRLTRSTRQPSKSTLQPSMRRPVTST